ncbi:MAG: cation diffusion facilitator family transporter [Nitrospirota bacterium]
MNKEQRLAWSLGIALLITVTEILGGYFSGSLALLSDAGHMFTDVFALGLSLMAARIGQRPPDSRATFGYQRVGILAAAVNGASLVIISAVIFYEAYKRFSSPPEIQTTVMLVVASAGLLANIAMIFLLKHEHHDLNIRSAWLHVLGDTISSFGVIVSAIVMASTGWLYADPLMSSLIGFIILAGGFRVVKEALKIFLQFAPKSIDANLVVRELCNMEGILGVHDIHIWSHIQGAVFLSAHIYIHDRRLSEVHALNQKIKEVLGGHGINHTTLEFECSECVNGGIYCELTHSEPHHHHDS